MADVDGWTTPRTWISGEFVTALMGNQQWRDNLLALRTKSYLTQTFRGLHLRTHPNADLSASQVVLIHADEIVMDVGARVGPWDNLPLDMTASGAGGLDTGTEAASTWYDIYAIRKSSDGTKNLLLHKSQATTSDQIQSTDDQAMPLRFDVATTRRSQSFTPSVSKHLELAKFKLQKQGTPTGTVRVELYASSGGLPTGGALAASDKLDVANIPTSAAWIAFPFRAPYALTASTMYHLVLIADYAISGANYLAFRGNSAGGYGGGGRCDYDGATWTGPAADDFTFETIVRWTDAAVTMPSGYDQRCLIGHVYNNSASNLDRFSQFGHRVMALSDRGTVGSFTSTTPVLTNLAAFVPPVPVSVDFQLGESIAGVFICVNPVSEGFAGLASSASWRFAGGAWGYALNATATAPSTSLGALPIAYQLCYVHVAGGTGTLWVSGWEW